MEKVGKSSERLGMRSGTETGESAKSQTAITSHRVLTTSEKVCVDLEESNKKIVFFNRITSLLLGSCCRLR